MNKLKVYWASFSLFSEFLWNITGLQHIELDERVSVGLNGNLYFSNAIETDSRRDYCCFAAFPRIRTIVQKSAMSVVVKSSTLKYSILRVWLHNMIISLHDQHQLKKCRSCLSDTPPPPQFLIKSISKHLLDFSKSAWKILMLPIRS